MSWLLVRRPDVPGGSAPLSQSDRPLRVGTLLLEFAHDPSDRPRNLLRHAARTPVPSGLTLCLDPDGRLRVMTRQGEATRLHHLSTGLSHPGEEALVRFDWDLDAGTGRLSCRRGQGTRHEAFLLDPQAPTPEMLAALADRTPLAPGVSMLAVADHLLPDGPLPGLCAQAMIAVPGGSVPVCRLVPGDRVLTVDRGVARIADLRSALLPAAGRFAPVLIRAPHLGLTEDILVAAHQRIRLRGAEVEYLFGQEEVAVPAGALVDGTSVLVAPGLRELTYHGLRLDRPGAIIASGLQVEPAETVEAPLRVLRDFEAQALRHMRAA